MFVERVKERRLGGVRGHLPLAPKQEVWAVASAGLENPSLPAGGVYAWVLPPRVVS